MNARPAPPPVAPAPHKKVAVKQSKYAELPTLPLRGIVLAPSGGGRSTLMQWLILTGYRGLFSRIHVISPSIHVDSETWDPVKRYHTARWEHLRKKCACTRTGTQILWRISWTRAWRLHSIKRARAGPRSTKRFSSMISHVV